MVEMLWTMVTPVFNELLRLAANWPLLFVDDTPAKIFELLEDRSARKEAGERVGIFTTVMVARQEGREIHLFFTGGNHAGENLAQLLDYRNDDLPPAMQMTDALSRNFPKNHLTIVTLCLVHAQRLEYHQANSHSTDLLTAKTHQCRLFKKTCRKDTVV